MLYRYFSWTLALALVLGAAGPSMAAEPNLAVGRMKITIMPEYDSQAVLVIQEGKFADKTAFPRTINFILPEEVTKLTDVCSLSPGGHHFCQLFEIENKDKESHLNVKLPYSDFFIDYQYAPFTVKANSSREFVYTVDTRYDINILEVHVQKPVRAEKFEIKPAVAETYEKDGFEYHKFRFENIKAGSKKDFAISYFKQDASPSVDIKYSAMISPEIFESGAGETLLAGGVIALVALWTIRRIRSKKGAAQ